MAEIQGNKRRADRLHHEILVAYRAGEKRGSGCALDISSVGIFLNALHDSDVFPVGTELNLIVFVPGESSALEIRGRVARCLSAEDAKAQGRAPGMGIEFVEMEQDQAARIEAAVQLLKAQLPGIDETAPQHVSLETAEDGRL